MIERTKVRIRILNEEYTIAGPRPADQMEAAAAYVNEVVREVSSSSVNSSATSLAVLAAIDIASELLELRARVEHLESAVSGGAAHMLAMLE